MERAERDRARYYRKGYLPARPASPAESAPLETGWEEVWDALVGLVGRLGEPEPGYRFEARPVTLDEKIEYVLERLSALTRLEFDALVTPSYAPAHPIDLVNPESFPGSCSGPAAIAGYPLVTVPTELAAGLPVAVSFWGTAGSEGTLIEIAHGYEVARDASTGPLPEPTMATFV